MSEQRAGLREVAEALDADADHIRQFAREHPSPSAKNILRAFGGAGEHEALVDAWLASRESATDRVRRRLEEDLDGGGLP